MSDDFEHLKPYLLALTYQDSPQPSELTASYDLHITYDPFAGGDEQIINALGFESYISGIAYCIFTQKIECFGLLVTGFGHPSVKNNSQFIQATGFNGAQFSNPSIINKNKEIKTTGFGNQIFGVQSKVYNLKQILNLSTRGINSVAYGTAYLHGGVKYISLNNRGFNVARYGSATVINTTADQYLNLSGKGITAPIIPNPDVSPRHLRPSSIKVDRYGSPTVFLKTRYLMLNGSSLSIYGTPWISHSPRYLYPNNIESYDSGYPKVFDAKQTVTVTGVIPGGIFGDIAIHNLTYKIAPVSIAAPELTNWNNVVNTARYYDLKGFDSVYFGNSTVQNATPSFAPEGFDSLEFGTTAIAERIRRLNLAGFISLNFGRPGVEKTPQITPKPIEPIVLGKPTLTLQIQYLVGQGRQMSVFGNALVAMAKRKIKSEGFSYLTLGRPSISHNTRELLFKGSNHSSFGTGHRVWFRVRSIEPVSIFEEQKAYGHRLGGTRYIAVQGFNASLFGKRIIPEHQDILASNFASSVFGQPGLKKNREYLSVTGFNTGGQQPADRWGKTTVYNLRQYIVQTFDIDSDLNPPKMQGWTSIANRNRRLGVTGFHTAQYGRPFINNKATPILPKGLDAQPLGIAFISHRIRPVHLEGIEAPYISGWSNLHNTADVIEPKGINFAVFGQAVIANTRRYFQRIGNFESLVFGGAMISYRIRELLIENRHAIRPIYIPIHKVELYKRYLEPGSIDQSEVGLPALTIHKKIITPRWYLKDLFGDAQLHNVTPEVKTRGRGAEEFGQAFLRTQWREVIAAGDNAQLFGKPNIAFRNRSIQVHSFNAGAIGPALRVRGTGSPPLSAQYIFLNNVDNRGEDPGDIDDNKILDGYGIGIPGGQVSSPKLKTNVINVYGFSASLFGVPDMYSNGILLENGIKLEREVGTPSVLMGLRTISITGISSPIEMGKPRLSPHTIYAVTEAPSQAIKNHPSRGLHAVNSSSGFRKAGEVFGMARVRTYSPYINLRSGILSHVSFGTARIALRRRYITVKGLQAYRMGWHSLGDGNQEITQSIGLNFAAFGNVRVSRPVDPNTYVRFGGLKLAEYGRHVVELLHRTVKPVGLNSLAMGSSRNGTLYMPQSLNVGPRRPTIPEGTLMEQFGTTYIGLFVRDIGVHGFDASSMGYEPINFKLRMVVKRGPGGNDAKPAQPIKPVGFNAFRTNASNVKHAVHYIRPDGNSDQFRKGAF
ncbi:hypothetical protein [Acinetobacter sp. YH12025]|uniref:hypothetical protein n=1 Tax=Acinetobacter sp. YH12025 TaxID=2601042 RepID=UPI0015D20A3F|nr:hypothetical protein [Acinetobacter sp. YH12025]